MHNTLGPGWNEWDYHRGMIDALAARGHPVKSHERKDLIHQGIAVDRFELDLLVDDVIVLERKHIKEDFHPAHFTQIINYLKCWNIRLGLLINFGQDQLRYKRVPFSDVDSLVEYTGCWPEIPLVEKEIIERAIFGVLAGVAYGYGADVFKKLLTAELGFMKVDTVELSINPAYGLMQFEKRVVDALAYGSKSLVAVSACSSATDLSYLKTYMKQSGRPYGILVSLDKSKIRLRGVV